MIVVIVIGSVKIIKGVIIYQWSMYTGLHGGVVCYQVCVMPRYRVVLCIVDPISDALSCVIVPRCVVGVRYTNS